MSGQETWPVDGRHHKDISYSGLYHNALIDNFFESDRTILIATKGMGKTLLLRAKKYILEKSDDGHLIIPRNQESDEPDFHGNLSSSGLDSAELWKDLWIISIIFSVMSHKISPSWGELDGEPIWNSIRGMNMPNSFKNELISDFTGNILNPPSYYLSKLLNLGVGALQKLCRTAFQTDAISRHYINSSTCVFIDSFDSALTEKFSFNLDVWKNAQIGLMQATHRLRCTNHHLKVYVSIRQEAWSAFKSDDRQVIKGQSVILAYDKRSLEQLFIHAIKKYARCNSVEKFVGLDKVDNIWTGESEKVFDYIYRHSICSPRSIMLIGSALHDLKLNSIPIAERPSEFRKKVNEIGSDQLYKDYLISQRKIFLNTLHHEDDVKNLLKLIPSNVLKGKTLHNINLQFSNNKGSDPKSSHPFCELFNVGVIGVVRREPSSNEDEQIFKRPDEYDWKKCDLLHKNNIYLIHPSLHKKITDIREQEYYLNPTNIVGNGRKWFKSENIRTFPMIFVSHSSCDKPQVELRMHSIEKKLDLLYPCDFWYDTNSILAGEDIGKKVEHGIENSDLVVVFISKASIKSGWVGHEWRIKHTEEIQEKQVKVICCILDDTQISDLPVNLQNKKTVILNQEDNEQEMDRMVLAITEYISSSRNIKRVN